MRPIIEFCASNPATDDLLEKLEENPDYDVIEYGCLGNCGECYLFPFAMVNGEMVAAETTELLYNEIIRKIKEVEAMLDLFDD
ncbi:MULTISPECIES: YuzB family protein [Paenibacillus]|uniref:DUF1450 domain-containing protein n=1 Tax=Paenibacillus lutrae TaxID=2078573 RepID=A0A7X3K0Z0_9BACL|nr:MULTISPECIES: YuzB family protein [Paenibacillus]MVP01734.1 DUF1450 domain-containing protein [Paenibacillus lutrae]